MISITAGWGDGGNEDYKTMSGMRVSDFLETLQKEHDKLRALVSQLKVWSQN